MCYPLDLIHDSLIHCLSWMDFSVFHEQTDTQHWLFFFIEETLLQLRTRRSNSHVFSLQNSQMILGIDELKLQATLIAFRQKSKIYLAFSLLQPLFTHVLIYFLCIAFFSNWIKFTLMEESFLLDLTTWFLKTLLLFCLMVVWVTMFQSYSFYSLWCLHIF
jgi:hypothetical protein